MKTAVVIGSTGMVGTVLIKQLIDSEEYIEIVSLVRRKSGVVHPKLSEHVVHFDDPETWKQLVKGDVLFSVMGTTIKNARTKENQYKVDYTYQYETAKIASENGIQVLVLVSSVGAKSSSRNFYLKTKGKLEDDVKKLPFRVISILQPGQLDGNRLEKRPMEKTALRMVYLLNKIGLLNKYRPIQASEMAQAMITTARKNKSDVYTLDKLFDIQS